MATPSYRSERPPRRVELTMNEEMRLRSLLRILDHFQDMSLQIPVSMVEIFLLIAMNEGCSLRELVELSGRPQSTVSRQTLDLAERNRNMEPGLGLVTWRIAPDELRRKEYYLTDKGKALLRRVLHERLEPPVPSETEAAPA
jgi:DNA-binding MarR family transcriptional regulator